MRDGDNLLPPRFKERLVERRRLAVTAGCLLALAILLVMAALGQARQLRAAEDAVNRESAQTEELLAVRTELAPFRALTDSVRHREALLSAAMDTEVSWAGVLRSLSAAFPGDASLTAVNAESTVPPLVGEADPAPGAEGRPIGTAVFNGYSVEAFSPGLAQLLQALDSVEGLSDARLGTGRREEIGTAPVTVFDGLMP